MASAQVPNLAHQEHDHLVSDARSAGGWTGCTIAAFAGTVAAESGLDIACPFGADESELARWWRHGFAQGRHATLPRATIHTFPRARGTTMAAHSAVND